MLPAIVIVALPLNTPPPDAQALLQACDAAYQAGACRESSEEPKGLHVYAELVWLSDTQAEISVRCKAPRAERSATRSLEFRPADEPLERYRSLGFAIGSMAGDVGQAATLTDTEPAASEPEPDEASASQPPITVPVFIDPPDPPSTSTGTSVTFQARSHYRFGVLAGSGLDALRWGVGVGARRVWSGVWLLDANASVATQNSTTYGVDGMFLNAALTVGVAFGAPPLSFGLSAGPAFQWQEFERASVGVGASTPRVGAELALIASYGDSVVAPFAELRGSWFDPVDIAIAETELRQFGPVQAQVIVGVVLTPGAR